MTLLSYNELVDLVEQGIITNVEPDQINAASIDITLGNEVLFEIPGKHIRRLESRKPINMVSVTLGEIDPLLTEFELQPAEFILAHSQQVFNLPNNISCEYKLKSSMARIGLNHLNAGWCDAGWFGSKLTLELVNTTRYHTIVLRPGDRIGQMVFFKHKPVPEDKSYAKRGRYNGDLSVQGVKL